MKTFGAKTKHILSSKRRALINAKPFSLMVRCPSIANATSIKSYIRHLFNGAGAKRALNFKQCVYFYSKIPCVLYVDSTTNIFIYASCNIIAPLSNEQSIRCQLGVC